MTTRRGFLGAALGLSTLAVPRRVLAHATEPLEVPVRDGAGTAPLNEPYGAYLNYNEFPEGPCPAAQAAIAAASPHAGHYCPGTVALLQHTLAETLQVPEAWLLLHPGSGPLLMLAAQVFTNPHRPLTTAALGYEKCSNGARTVNAPVNPVPLLSNGAHDLDRMRAAPSGLIYVCNPNNPTGTITLHDRLVAFLAHVPSDTIVIIDEAYIHFSDQPSMVPLVARYPNLLVTRTFSKAYGMAGVRCGFAVGQPQTLARLERMISDVDLSVLAASASIASLQQPNLLAERKALNARRRDATRHWLQQHGFACTASEANFFMIDLKRPARAVVEALSQRHVHISSRWKALPNTVRISIGTDQEMAAFRRAFAEVMGLNTKADASPA